MYLVAFLTHIYFVQETLHVVIMQGNSRGYLYHDDFHSLVYRQGEHVLCEITVHSGTTLSSRQVYSSFHVLIASAALMKTNVVHMLLKSILDSTLKILSGRYFYIIYQLYKSH